MYVCRKIRLFVYLKERGFTPLFSRPDVNNPKYTIWIFKDSQELKNTVEEYYKNLKDIINKTTDVDNVKDKIYVCKRIRLCSYLLERGFRYEKQSVDVYNPEKKVWLFKDSKKLRECIEKYYNEK